MQGSVPRLTFLSPASGNSASRQHKKDEGQAEAFPDPGRFQTGSNARGLLVHTHLISSASQSVNSKRIKSGKKMILCWSLITTLIPSSILLPPHTHTCTHTTPPPQHPRTHNIPFFCHFWRSLFKVPSFSSHSEACVSQGEREPITKHQLICEMAKRGHGFDRGSLTP